MRKNLRRPAVVVVVAALLAAGANVHAGETDRAVYELALSTQQPGAPTGLSFHILYKHPEDPDAKPPALTGAVFELPRGLRIDDGAIPQCTASDADFRARGRDACPSSTRVGDGTLTAMTGFPGVDPVETDVVVFNGEGELIEVVFFKGTNVVAGMDRLTIEPGRLVAHPPATPGGPPDGRTAVREIRIDLPARSGAAGRPYVTAPPDCPDGVWLSRARYEFNDGGRTTVTSKSPCEPDADARPSIAVATYPRRIRAGKRARLAIRVRSSDPRCVKRARVRVGGKRTRTNRRGRARLTVRFARRGKKRVRATKRGCRKGLTHLRVRRRRG